MLIGYKRGQGSIVLRIKILNSSVATGAGLTGLSSASSGLIISTIADNESLATAYTVAASNIETITTLGTYVVPSSGKCRFKEVDATNHKGVYEIQLDDARFNVNSAKSLLVSVLGATNAAETDVVIPLRDLDPFDSVRAGLTALPNVSSGSAGAIITSGTGTAQLSVTSGLVTLDAVTHTGATIPTVTSVTNRVTANADQLAGQTITAAAGVTFPTSVASPTNITSVGSVTGAVGSVTAGVTVSANNDKTGYSLTQAFPTNFSSLAITAGGSVTAGTVNDKTGYSLTQLFPTNFANLGINSSGDILRVSLVDTTTTNTDMRGTDNAALASDWTSTRAGYLDVATSTRLATSGYTTPPTVSQIVDGVWDEQISGHLISGSTGASLNASGSSGDPWTTSLPGVYGVGTAGYILGSVAAGVVVTTNNDKTGYNLTQSFPTNFSNLAITAGGSVTAGTVSDKTGYSLASSQTFSTTGAVGSVTTGVVVTTNNDKTGYNLTQTFPSNFSSLAITAGGSVTAGTVSDKTGYSLAQSFPANFSSLAITAGGSVTAGTVSDKTGYSLASSQTFSTTGAVGSVTAGVVVTTNNDKTGYSLTQAFPSNFSSLAITAGGSVTAGTVSDKTGYSLASSQTFSTTGAVGSVTAGVVVTTNNDKTGYSLASSQTFSTTGAVGSVTAGVVVTTNNDKTGYSLASGASILSTQLVESYRSAGTAPTLEQAILEIIAHMGQSAIVADVKQLRGIDGTTIVKTYKLDTIPPTQISEQT